jgi:hypothetical protein
MTSEINLETIQKLLNENVEIGNPESKGFPLVVFQTLKKSDKIFYGKLDEIEFELTSNTILNTVPYIIKGTLEYKNDLQTEVNYKIKRMKFPYFMMLFVSLFTASWSLFAIIQNSDLIVLAILVNLIMFSIIFIKNRTNIKKLKKMENDFKSLIKITN